MSIKEKISGKIQLFLEKEYSFNIQNIDFQQTRKDVEGDITIVTFPFVRAVKKAPEQVGEEIGEMLLKEILEISSYNVIKGFLNLVFTNDYFVHQVYTNFSNTNYGLNNAGGKKIMVEYCSPNTNKPLHLGHVRNNLLGFSTAQLLESAGNEVVKTQIINDRGIHICKSMLAWQKYGNGATPESSGKKGDKLVGDYYVKFDKEYKIQIQDGISAGKTEEEAKKTAPLLLEAQEMLLKWEQGDKEVVELWKTMNQWVFAGFDATNARMGVSFDDVNYESQTYLLGKDIIEKGLKNNVFFKKEDGSVWIDLTDDGLDEKLVLRSDGTSVYMTQDLGTAVERFKKHDIQQLIYTVGNEQDYHFKVLFLIMKKLGFDWAANMYHLSYGMVDLPTGKMKSREGTVVDADDLMEEMVQTAKSISQELGKLDGLAEQEKEDLYEMIGLGALKYYILKVDPKKRILFDPQKSIDFQGNTGPFIQYTHARIQSVLSKVDFDIDKNINTLDLSSDEKNLIKGLLDFEETIKNAAENLNIAAIANYVYELVKMYNSFYQNNSILNVDQEEVKVVRTQLSKWTAIVIKNSMHILGIQVPNRM